MAPTVIFASDPQRRINHLDVGDHIPGRAVELFTYCNEILKMASVLERSRWQYGHAPFLTPWRWLYALTKHSFRRQPSLRRIFVPSPSRHVNRLEQAWG